MVLLALCWQEPDAACCASCKVQLPWRVAQGASRCLRRLCRNYQPTLALPPLQGVLVFFT
jgi:hypothetical protein